MSKTSKPQPLAALPAHEQTMRLACEVVVNTLRKGMDYACGPNWDDAWTDHINAVELAKLMIERLKASLPTDKVSFERDWWLAGGAISLVVETFPAKDTAAWRFFESAYEQMRVLAEAVEWVDLGRQG